MNKDSYDIILKDGERFWDMHDRYTVFEVRYIVNLMKVAHRIPKCMWDEIKHIHATNYSTIWQITERWYQYKYPDTIGNTSPNISFMEWILKGLTQANPNPHL